MTVLEELIKEFEELKKTKLYENSFKSIDDCIFLLYTKKKHFEYLEFQEKQRIKQFHKKYNYKVWDIVVSKYINCGSYDYTILVVKEIVDHRYIKGDVILSNKYKVGEYDILWNRINFEKICGPINR